jgi:hypothetical protein
MDKPWQSQKVIRFRKSDWQVVKDMAELLSAERGAIVSMPSTVLESVKFYREHRLSPAGTPGVQARSKGVITE